MDHSVVIVGLGMEVEDGIGDINGNGEKMKSL